MRVSFKKAAFSALSTAAVVFAVSGGAFAQFTQGNLVVSRVGTGAATLDGSATAAFLDQYTTSGNFVNTTSLPTAVSGSNRRVTNSGSATSEGFLSRSQDNRYLIYTGYDATVGTASISTSSTATYNRIIARISSTGAIDSSTSITDGYNAVSVRGAASVDGNSFYAGGAGTTTTGGVRYATLGATTTTQVENAIANVRVTNIFNNQLFFSTGSVTNGIYSLGTPSTASGQTPTLLVATGNVTGNVSSPYDFAINSTGTTVYVADDRTNGSGGIQRYDLSSGVFTLSYTLSTGTTTGARGLTVDFSGANAVLYATTTETSGNRVVSFTDTGAGSSLNLLATAATNTAFRDVVFSPFVVSANTPEPGTLALLGTVAVPGMGLLAARRRRKAA